MNKMDGLRKCYYYWKVGNMDRRMLFYYYERIAMRAAK